VRQFTQLTGNTASLRRRRRGVCIPPRPASRRDQIVNGWLTMRWQSRAPRGDLPNLFGIITAHRGSPPLREVTGRCHAGRVKRPRRSRATPGLQWSAASPPASRALQAPRCRQSRVTSSRRDCITNRLPFFSCDTASRPLARYLALTSPVSIPVPQVVPRPTEQCWYTSVRHQSE
jgi:hypothetical protein